MAENPLEFLFTPGFRPSFDDPDGTKKQVQSLEISGKPGTIKDVLGQLPTATMQGQAVGQPNLPASTYADVEFLNSLVGASPSAPVESQGEFSKGVSRGYRQLKADLVATGGTLAQLMGFDEASNSAFQKYKEIMEDAAKYPATVSRVEDAFESPGAFVNWASGLLGEQMPIVASIVATGVGGGLLARLAAKGAISNVTADLAAKKISSWGLRGATTGIVAGTSAIETGGMTGEQIDAGVPVQPATNLLLGTTAGVAEAVSPIVLARMFGLKLPFAQRFADNIVETMAGKGLVKRMATGALTIAGTEAGTETFQEALAIAARKFADENYDTLGEEAVSRVVNAAAGGVLLGTLFGGLGGIKKTPTGSLEQVDDETAQLALPAPTMIISPGGVATTESTAAELGLDEVANTVRGTAAATASDLQLSNYKSSAFGAIREGRLDEPTILFTEQGKEELNPDAIMARTAEITEALTVPETRTLAHSALLREVENQRLADFRRLFEIKQPSQQLGKLLSLRSTLSEAENTNPVIEKKIEKLSEMIDVKAKEEEITLPKSSYLNEKENSRLAYLIEKERTDGLSQKETDSLEKLMSKAQGEKPASRVTATDKDIAKLEAEVESVIDSPGPLYADQNNTRNTGLTPEELQSTLAPIINTNIPLRILEHPAQLSGAAELQKYILRSGKKVNGAYHRGQVYLFSRNISKDNAIKVYLHEAAHYGLHNVMPEVEFKNIIKAVEKVNSKWVDDYLFDRNFDVNNEANRARGAEEYIARIAEDGSNIPLLRKIIAMVRRWLRNVIPNLRITDDEIRLVLQGLSKEKRGPITQRKRAPNMPMTYLSDFAQAADDVGKSLKSDYTLAAKDVEKLSHLWRIKAETIALSPLQLVQRYGVEPLQRYINIVDKWARTKSEILSPADDVVSSWLQLSKNKANAVSSALFDLTIESDEKSRKLTIEEEHAILAKHKVDGDALNIYKSVVSSFTNILGRLEHGLKYNAARETLGNEAAATKFLTDWEATVGDNTARMNLVTNLVVDPSLSINLVRRIQSIEKEMDRLKNRNYFPYMRFGKYSVTAKNAKGETTGFWTFETAKAQEDFVKSEEATGIRNQGNKLAMSVLTDTQFAFIGMPPSFMDTLTEELELSTAQKDQLKEIFIRQSPGRAFLRHLIKRKGIAGFSQDAMRVYSTYMMNASNHLARVENYVDMDKALTDFKNLRYDIEERTGDSRGLMTLFNSFQQHRNYIMNPGNELANLRALGFMWYLGFNVKSALVNMTQVPMVAYPYLATRYGDAASVSQLTSAIKTATNVFRGKQGYDPTVDQLIARGIKEGFLDESLATELAGIAEGSTLARMMPVDAAQRRLNQFSYYGSFLFRNAEKFARIVTFTAAAKLEMNKGGDSEAMFHAGKEAVRATMFEYAKWNRPTFMRGKASVFFLFWTFMQNMAYISFGGQGAQTAIRVWIMLALMAGLQGLPFAENLLDILDWGNEKVRRTLGLKGHYTDLRTEIRELLTGITDNPDMIMHGLSRYYGLGPAHLLSLIGVPVPSVDTSSSLSMGRILPGIKEMVGSERNPEEKFGRTILELAGPVFGMPYALWRAVEDNDPDSWKRFERAMPIAIKSASKASRYLARGEEEFRGGGAVAKFDPYNTEHTAEVTAQALGFTPSRVSQRYELRAAQQMMKEYFTVRRDVILDEYAFSYNARDREAMADVRDSIRNYNNSVPHPALKIGADDLSRSLKARQKGAQQRETLTPAQKQFQGAFREIGQAYPNANTPR